LLEQDEGALSVQVLQEFYVPATRSTRPDSLPHEIAAGLITTWMRFRMQEITLSILGGALEITAAHGFSYWDSAIIATARALGCREVYTTTCPTVGRSKASPSSTPSADPPSRQPARWPERAPSRQSARMPVRRVASGFSLQPSTSIPW